VEGRNFTLNGSAAGPVAQMPTKGCQARRPGQE